MKLCVLIPAFNESKVLRKTIRSVFRAEMRPEDIYVVDDGSVDQTSAAAHYYQVEVYSKPNGGKATALQGGVRFFSLASRYTHIAVLDADSTVSPTYFREMRKAIWANPQAVLYCGAPRSLPHNWLTAYRAVEYAISLGVYREAQAFIGAVNVAPGCASVYCLKTFTTLSFDGGTLVEDMDLTIQVQRRRLKIIYVPEAIVYTQDPGTLRGFIGQIARWYRGTWQIVKKYRLVRRAQVVDVEMGLMLVEGIGFALMLLLLPIVLYTAPKAFLGIFILDQALMLTFTLLVAIRERRTDVVWAFPLYSIPRLLNSMVFLWTFCVERRTRKLAWFSVARY